MTEAALQPGGRAVKRLHRTQPKGLYLWLVLRKKIDPDGFKRRLNEVYAVRSKTYPEVSDREWERRAGFTTGQLRRWLNGERGKKISFEAIYGLSYAFACNENWLGWGEGPRDLDDGTKTLEARFLARFPNLDEEQRVIVHQIFLRNPGANADLLAKLIEADNTVKAVVRKTRKGQPSQRQPRSRRDPTKVED